ncbi:MAG: PEP-CTERM sorting domain-containing protein [Colwellia sp.]|nr:PEP-CTERM sorting domain-containing protein [Colwellia sp.]
MLKAFTKPLVATLAMLSISFTSSAALVDFDINETFVQGNGQSDLSTYTFALSDGSVISIDPGSSFEYLDFMMNGTGTFATTGNQISGYYFLNSFSAGDIIGDGTFNSDLSVNGDWDTILVGGSTFGVWDSSHNGALAFITAANNYGYISYDYTRESGVSSISLNSGVMQDVANMSLVVGGTIPEPTSIALFGLALAGLGIRKANTKKSG